MRQLNNFIFLIFLMVMFLFFVVVAVEIIFTPNFIVIEKVILILSLVIVFAGFIINIIQNKGEL